MSSKFLRLLTSDPPCNEGWTPTCICPYSVLTSNRLPGVKRSKPTLENNREACNKICNAIKTWSEVMEGFFTFLNVLNDFRPESTSKSLIKQHEPIHFFQDILISLPTLVLNHLCEVCAKLRQETSIARPLYLRLSFINTQLRLQDVMFVLSFF